MDYRRFELITCEPFNGNDIAVFCREDLGDESQRVRIDVPDFEPYFYIWAGETERARELMDEGWTVDDEPAISDVREGFHSRLTEHDLTKVVLNKPGQTREAREQWESPPDSPIESWESDINYTMRFRVDTDIKSVFRIPSCMMKKKATNRWEVSWSAFEPLEEEDAEIPPRNFYFDIEVGGEDQTMPEDDDLNPISCITAFDSYSERMITWVWRDDLDQDTIHRQYKYRENSSYVGDEEVILEQLQQVYNERAEEISEHHPEDARHMIQQWVADLLFEKETERWWEIVESVEWSGEDIHSWVWDVEDRLEAEIPDEEPEWCYDWQVRTWNSERKMLGNFFSHFKTQGYDVLSGWYSDKYDVPYLVERADDLGLDPSMWSEMGNVDSGLPLDSWGQAKVSGTFMNDLERRYDNVVGPQSSALESVAKEEELMEWEQESGSIQALWDEDPRKMIEYNGNDVVATQLIDDKAGITDFFFQKMYMTGCRVEEIEQDSNVITYYLMFEGSSEDILPRARVRTHKEFGGGRVILPETQGIISPIAVLDLSKIYPSIMITLGLSYENVTGVDPILFRDEMQLEDKIPEKAWDSAPDSVCSMGTVIGQSESNNKVKLDIEWSFEHGDVISPLSLGKDGRKEIWDYLWDMDENGSLRKSLDWEFVEPDRQLWLEDYFPDDHTIDRDHEGTRLPNGVRINQDQEGLVTQTLLEMFELRFSIEDIIETLDQSADDYKERYDRLMQKRQNYKDQINAVFGYAGYKKSPLFRPEIAMTTTFVGRNILKMCEIVAEELGHKVRYGDTDSIMVELQDDIYDPDENLGACVYEGHRVGELVNARMDDFAENFCNIGRDDHMFELEFEKLYSTMFIGNKKKRYAGLKTVTE